MHPPYLISLFLLPLSTLAIPIPPSDNSLLIPSISHLETRNVIGNTPKNVDGITAGESASAPPQQADFSDPMYYHPNILEPKLAPWMSKPAYVAKSAWMAKSDSAKKAVWNRPPVWARPLTPQQLDMRMVPFGDVPKSGPEEITAIPANEGTLSSPAPVDPEARTNRPVSMAPDTDPEPWMTRPKWATEAEWAKVDDWVKRSAWLRLNQWYRLNGWELDDSVWHTKLDTRTLVGEVPKSEPKEITAIPKDEGTSLPPAPALADLAPWTNRPAFMTPEEWAKQPEWAKYPAWRAMGGWKAAAPISRLNTRSLVGEVPKEVVAIPKEEGALAPPTPAELPKDQPEIVDGAPGLRRPLWIPEEDWAEISAGMTEEEWAEISKMFGPRPTTERPAFMTDAEFKAEGLTPPWLNKPVWMLPEEWAAEESHIKMAAYDDPEIGGWAPDTPVPQVDTPIPQLGTPAPQLDTRELVGVPKSTSPKELEAIPLDETTISLTPGVSTPYDSPPIVLPKELQQEWLKMMAEKAPVRKTEKVE